MTDPLTAAGLTAAKTIAPLAGRQLQQFVKGPEVRVLIRASKKQMKKDYRVPPGHKKAIRKRVGNLMKDPEGLGCLWAVLQDGSPQAHLALRRRATEVLAPPAGTYWSIDDVVDAFMDCVDRNLLEAKSSDRRALDAATRRVAAVVSENVIRGLADAESANRTRDDERADGMVISARSDLVSASSGVDRWFGELRESEPQLAAEVATRREANNLDNVADWLDAAPPELTTAGLPGLVALGRLLAATGQSRAAQAVFERASALDTDDPARQLVRAANSALATGDKAEFAELLKRARALGGNDHPAVVLAEIRQWKKSPEEELQRLATVTPEGPIESALVAMTEAQAHLMLGDCDAADEAAARALGLDPGNVMVRELIALSLLLREQRRFQDNREVEAEALELAADQFLTLRDELLSARRFDESGHMLGRAIEARLLSGDFDEARRLLGPEVMHEREHEGPAAIRLADAAVLANHPARALELVRGDDLSDEATLVRAESTINTQGAEMDQVDRAVETLDELLMSSSEDIGVRAALSRVLAAAFDPRIARSDDAESRLALADEVAESLLRAQAHLTRGELREAEDIFLRHTSDDRALSGLVDVAVARDDLPAAIELQDSLLALRSTPRALLRKAELLEEDGQKKRAAELCLRIADDTSVPLTTRRTAFREGTRVLREYADPAELVVVTDKWLEVEPDAQAAHWVRAWARTRAGDFNAALTALDEAHITPETVQQATLLSGLISRELDVETALARIAALSDSFDRPEDLEVAVLITALRREAALPAELEARVRQTFADFHERFPDSRQVTVVEIPEDEESFREFMEQLAPDRSLADDFAHQVATGDAALASLAAAVGKTVSEAWASVGGLPLGFSSPTVDALELEDARTAVGRSVVVDPAAAVVAADLSADLRRQCFDVLPGAVIAESALHDLVSAADPLTEPERQIGSLTRDPTSGEPWLVEADPEAVEATHARLTTALESVRGLQVKSDVDPESDEQLNQLMISEGDEETPGAFRVLLATASLAKRTGLPVWTDDRWLRAALRQLGVRTFSTFALLDALRERGLTTPDAVADARLTVLRRGAFGLHPSGHELVELERSAGDRSSALARAIGDQTAWTHNGDELAASITEFLHSCYQREPGSLLPSVAWCLRVVRSQVPGFPIEALMFSLLVNAFGLRTGIEHADVPFVRALIRALRRSRGEAGVLADPLWFSLAQIARATRQLGPEGHAMLLARILTMLSFADQPAAFAAFVSRVDL